MKKLLPRKEYFATLPKKPLAGGALFFDRRGRLLIMRPTYRKDWIIPGGMVEAGESPFQACVREVKEELGLKLKIGRLLCVDYQPVRAKDFIDDSMQFIFDGGVLTDKQIEKIVIDPEEHLEYRFVTQAEALRLLNPELSRRTKICLALRKRGSAVYLENDERV